MKLWVVGSVDDAEPVWEENEPKKSELSKLFIGTAANESTKWMTGTADHTYVLERKEGPFLEFVRKKSLSKPSIVRIEFRGSCNGLMCLSQDEDDVVNLLVVLHPHVDIRTSGIIDTAYAFHLILRDQNFIDYYNCYDRNYPWIFSYAIVNQDRERVGFIYGVRSTDQRRVTIGPFKGGEDWVLIDTCDSLMLFYDTADPFSVVLLVVNPINKRVDTVILPPDVPLDYYHEECDIHITTDGDGYKIVYLKLVKGIPQYCKYHSWARQPLIVRDEMAAELDQSRNIVLSRGSGTVLYTVFYEEGDNAPVYKVTSFYEVPKPQGYDDQDVEDMPFSSWFYCGGLAFYIECFENKVNGNTLSDIISMGLYKRNENGSAYTLLKEVPRDMYMPMPTNLASITVKEVEGELNVALQTNRIGVDVDAKTYIYLYHVKNDDWLKTIVFAPADPFSVVLLVVNPINKRVDTVILPHDVLIDYYHEECDIQITTDGDEYNIV
ncbi:hypothetical protein Tco_1089092 [Tanacetum coccineum]